MKKFYFLFFILFSICSNAQIIEFEDEEFKQELLSSSPTKQIVKDLNGEFIHIDLNNNNEIEITEAENVSFLYIQVWDIESAQELNYFKNVRELTFRISHITQLDLIGLQDLTYLDLEQNNLSELSITGSPLLENLKINENSIASLTIEHRQNIKIFNCTKNELTNLNLSGFTNLQELYCADNNLTSLNFTPSNYTIKILSCGMNDFSNGLNLSNLVNLEKLTVFYAYLSNIDVSNLTKLYWLALGWNNITNLNVNTLNSLEYLNLDRNELTSLDITQNHKLKNLILSSNELNTLNIDNCPDLVELRCESNNLSTFSASNLNSLAELDFQSNDIESISLENLISLKSLDCSGNQLQILELENLPLLENLYLSDNALTEINLDSMNIVGLYLDNNDLLSCNISNMDNLHFVHMTHNPITDLTLVDLPALENLNLSENELVSVNLENLPELRDVYLNNNNLNTLEINDLPKLTLLYLSHNELTSLQFNNTPKLAWLELEYNNFTSFTNYNLPLVLDHPNMLVINLNNNELLEEIELVNIDNLSHLYSFSNPALTTVNLAALNDLSNLTLSDNSSLEEIDLSGLFTNNEGSHLTAILDLSYNENLKKVFFKTGLIFYESNFKLAECPNLEYVCTDEFNIQNVQNVSENVVINSYCTFTPGGEYYTIGGKNRININDNANCEDDAAFYPFLKFNFNYDGIDTQVFSNSEGEYMFYHNNESNTIVITPQLENPSFFSIYPESAIINLPLEANPYLQDFCLTPAGNFNDLEIMIVPIDEARPGFEVNYKLVYKNKGTTELTGEISLTFEENFMEFVSSVPETASQIPHQLSWNYIDLLPFETREIAFSMTMNTPIDPEFPLNDGDILNFESRISPTDEDQSPTDNISVFNQLVVNSFDPNDKVCLEGTSIGPEKIGEFVHYRIRFENTGSANAINIVVKDIIDITKFDIGTLTPISGSHPFETKIIDENQVEFIFENINLPFDDENNDGYIMFKIKTLTTLELNDSFSNQADIYFDYNAPITTEEYTTLIEILSINDFEDQNASFSIYPNPVDNNLVVKTEYKIDKIEIFDVTQRLLISKINPNNKINTVDLKSGVYFLRIRSGNITETIKFIKK